MKYLLIFPNILLVLQRIKTYGFMLFVRLLRTLERLVEDSFKNGSMQISMQVSCFMLD